MSWINALLVFALSMPTLPASARPATAGPVDLSPRTIGGGEVLELQTEWAGNWLELDVRFATPVPDWRFDLAFDSGPTLMIGPGQGGSRVVQLDALTYKVLVLMPAATVMRLQSAVPAPTSVVVPRIWAFSGQGSLGRMPGGSIVYYDQQVRPNEAALGHAFGELSRMHGSGNIGSCTAFRAAPQLWITALHCTNPPPGFDGPVTMLRIVRNDYRDSPGTEAGPIEVIATGFPDGRPDGGREKSAHDLDYAILSFPTDPGGPSLSLASGSRLSRQELEPNRMRLTVLQHYVPQPGAGGKARSNDPGCTITGPRPGPSVPENLCPAQLLHSCSTIGGGSGGALVTQDTYRLAGVHIFEGQPTNGDGSTDHNCALPVDTIVDHLCRTNGTIAQRIGVSCK